MKKTRKPVPNPKDNPPKNLKDGARCKVVLGTHAGKSGTVRYINTSKTGFVTITVVQANGERFKTLAKNTVTVSSSKIAGPAVAAGASAARSKAKSPAKPKAGKTSRKAAAPPAKPVPAPLPNPVDDAPIVGGGAPFWGVRNG